MAENITLAPVTSFTNDSSAVATVNANNVLIQTAFLDVLSRSGSSPNSMQSVLDMNSFNIVNLPPPATLNSPVRLVDAITPSIALTVPPVGTSGSTVPLLNGINTWSGQQQWITSGDPFTNIVDSPPTFPLCNTANRFLTTGTTTHTDFRSTLDVTRNASGSGVDNGAADVAIVITTTKSNRLTSIVHGDLYGGFITITGGSFGANLGLQCLSSAIKNTNQSAVLNIQSSSRFQNSSGQNIMDINTTMGIGEEDGGLSGGTGFGFVSESWGVDPVVGLYTSQLTPYAAYAGGAFDASNNFGINGSNPLAVPTFTNFIVGYGSRTEPDIFFRVSQGRNLAGQVYLGSSIPTSGYGTPTLSGGARLSFANVGGSFTYYGADGTTPLMQWAQAPATPSLGLSIILTGTVSNFALLQTVGGSGYRWSLNNDTNLYLNSTVNGFAAQTQLFKIGLTGNTTSAGNFNTYAATATPAAAGALAAYKMGVAGVGIYWGTGSPSGVVTAPQGSLYIRTDGAASTGLYLNKDGSTTWGAVTSA